ncbi:hypothetical protein GJ496_009596 [Pomphorhynchus laevis]|nr:hypothetical protein GJ496_009596 [Pomphorhynchus laevis]
MSKTEIIGVPDAIQICSNLCHSSPANNTTGNVQLLGSPIGSTDFIKDVLLRDLLPRLTKEIEVIANLPDPQSAYLLLRHCASAPKIGHLMHTISPLTLRGFTQAFDDVIMKAFENLTASQLTVSAKIQASLPFRLGGFGLRNTIIHSSNAFVKSVRAVSEISYREPNQYVGFEGALSELSVLTGKDNLQHICSDGSTTSFHIDRLRFDRLLEESNNLDKARLRATACSKAASWL